MPSIARSATAPHRRFAASCRQAVWDARQARASSSTTATAERETSRSAAPGRFIHVSASAPSTSALPPFQRFLDAEREVVWRYLVSMLGRADAEDCFQETFASALRAYPRLRP